MKKWPEYVFLEEMERKPYLLALTHSQFYCEDLDTSLWNAGRWQKHRLWGLAEGRYATGDMPLVISVFQALSLSLFLSCHVSGSFALLFVPCSSRLPDYRPKSNEYSWPWLTLAKPLFKINLSPLFIFTFLSEQWKVRLHRSSRYQVHLRQLWVLLFYEK